MTTSDGRGRSRERPNPPIPSAADRSPFFRPSKPIKNKNIDVVVTTTPGGSRKVVKRAAPQSAKKDGTKVEQEEEAKSGVFGTTANNISVIVGAGIVGMPYALRESGFLAGLVMLVVVAILTEKSLRLLVDTGKFLGVPSYETLMEATFGQAGYIFISVNMFITSYGGCLSYLIIIKDTVPTLLGVGNTAADVPMRRAILVVSSICVILPLSLQRDMANLSKTSTISVLNDIAVVFIIVFFAPVSEGVEAAGGWAHILTHDTVQPSTLFVGLGVLSFAFVCQDSAFLIAGSLENPTRGRWGKVTGFSLATCGTLATLCGISGYLAFGMDTEGNILNNFSSSSGAHQGAASAARALLGMTMFFVYPLSSYVCRHILIVLFFKGRTAHEGDDHSVLARRDRRVVTTVAVFLSALIPALIVDDLGVVLGLAGAVGASCIAYIGPGVTYLAAHGSVFLASVEEAWDYGATAIMAGGVNHREGLSDATVHKMWKHPRQDRARQYYRQERSGGDGARKRTPPHTHQRKGNEEEAALPGENVPLASSYSFQPMEQEVSQDIEWFDNVNVGRSLCGCLGASIVVALWYLLLMPLWCAIASVGGRRVREYEEDQALKSPRPSRLGRIVHDRAVGAAGAAGAQDDGAGSEEGMLNEPRSAISVSNGGSNALSPKKFINPGEYGATTTTVTGGGASSVASAEDSATSQQFGNQAIAKSIADSLKRQAVAIGGGGSPQTYDENGEELREEDLAPRWYDFLIAICYIFLGLVAVSAGVVSISMGG